MWPFSAKQSIAGSGVLQGFTDWHCHLLPGVDDGVQTVEESLQVLALYEKQGVGEVWLTPHIMEDYPNTPAKLRARFAELSAAYKGHIKLHLAAEHMLDSLFEERLAGGEVMPLGEDGGQLLVETSFFNPPYGLKDVLRRIMAKGFVPVLAHPERYLYMDRADYRELREMNVLFQLNIPSLASGYGTDARRKAEWLLRNGFYQYAGTDTHRLKGWRYTSECKVAKKLLRALRVDIIEKA